MIFKSNFNKIGQLGTGTILNLNPHIPLILSILTCYKPLFSIKFKFRQEMFLPDRSICLKKVVFKISKNFSIFIFY